MAYDLIVDNRYTQVSAHSEEIHPASEDESLTSRVSFIVDIVAPTPEHTRDVPNFAQRAIALLPGLVRHRCESGAHRSFESELQDTELAHALEHMAIELLAQSNPDTPRANHYGETGWNTEIDGKRRYRVRLYSTAPAEDVMRAMIQACELLVTLL